MTGNCHVRFLRGWGAAMRPGYLTKWRLRSLAVVVSDDASEHLAVTDGSLSGDGDHAQRTVLFETLMGAAGIVVRP